MTAKKTKNEAIREKFELLHFGILCQNENEFIPLNNWRYFYCHGATEFED